MNKIKLVGYSSDDITNVEVTSKETRRPIYHYIVNGRNRYYYVERPVSLFNKFSDKKEIIYVGVIYSIYADTKVITRSIEKNNNHYCCYCEVRLTEPSIPQTSTQKTREHIIPKSRGGKIVKACCYECNQEKGGLMLHSYIQYLNYLVSEYKGELLEKLQRKIKNANKIAKEIEDKQSK